MTTDDGLELPGPDPRSPEVRPRGYRTGQARAPNWDAGDLIDGLETTLVFAGETMAPESGPILMACLTGMSMATDVVMEKSNFSCLQNLLP